MALPVATSDTRLILEAVRAMFHGFLRKGCAYKRCGVALIDLARPESLQGDLFQAPVQGNTDLMSTLDAINRKFGRGTAGFASAGWQKAPAWGMRQANVSPQFTTRWSELPLAKC